VDRRPPPNTVVKHYSYDVSLSREGTVPLKQFLHLHRDLPAISIVNVNLHHSLLNPIKKKQRENIKDETSVRKVRENAVY